MRRIITVTSECWPLAREFRIARGARTQTEVVLLTIQEGDHIGRGEAVPTKHYGETIDSVLAQISERQDALAQGLDRLDVQHIMPPGAARNAVDCALWDLSAKQSGQSVADLLGIELPPIIQTVQTISLGALDAMARDAQELADYPAIKVKVDREAVLERLAVIHENAPKAQLVVDANEAWDMELMASLEPKLPALGVRLLEQPLPAGQDDGLKGYSRSLPICADESCHTADDLENLKGKYDAVNIKLDKTGGLTEAVRLLRAAEAENMAVMVGCMIGTSLSMAPAMLVAARAAFVDLDGPTWLAKDRPAALRFDHGALTMPDKSLWGYPAQAKS